MKNLLSILVVVLVSVSVQAESYRIQGEFRAGNGSSEGSDKTVSYNLGLSALQDKVVGIKVGLAREVFRANTNNPGNKVDFRYLDVLLTSNQQLSESFKLVLEAGLSSLKTEVTADNTFYRDSNIKYLIGLDYTLGEELFLQPYYSSNGDRKEKGLVLGFKNEYMEIGFNASVVDLDMIDESQFLFGLRLTYKQ